VSLGSMANELTGVVSQMPPDYAKTCVQRAWADVQRHNLWSFLMFEANWTSPAIVNAGTVTVTQGNNTVVFNSSAATAINAIGLFPSSVIARQFRVGIGTIYNIWKWDGVNTATLDRKYQEASGSNIPYAIYQAYYPSPVKDFWTWLNVRDIVNFNDLITNRNRDWIDLKDPQRSIYYIPTHVVPYQLDLNPDSPTYQYPMFELWGQPQYQLTYQLAGLRKSWPLVNPTDTLPQQVGEDCVMSLARYYGYQWAEANYQREWGPKPNYTWLMREEVSNDRRRGVGIYNRLFAEYRMQDRSTMDNFKTRLRRGWSFPNADGWYSSIAGQATPGAPW
jgi:hypothetical protein